MKPLFTFTSVLLLHFIVLGNLAVAQSEYNQLVEDVKRVCEHPHADKAEVDRLNRQIRQIYENNAEPEVIEALKVFHVVSLSDLINEIAEQIDERMRRGQFARIGIPEFTTGADQKFDPEYGALPRHIAESLRHALAKKIQRHRSYSVLSEEALHNTLKGQGITPDDLRTGKTKNLQNQADGKDVSILVDGNLNRVGESGMTLTVNLIDTTKGSLLDGQIVGRVLLNSNEWAMSGVSKSRVSPELPGRALRYRLEPGVGLVPEQLWAKVQLTRGAVVEAHPLAPGTTGNNADGKFDVWVETRPNSRGAYRKLRSDQIRFNGNDCYVGLAKGEEFQIVFKAESSDDIFVRVLVDGLNTLSQHQKVVPTGTRGAYVEAVLPDSEGELVVAPRVSLEEARPWVVPGGSKNLFSVPGFFDVREQNDTVRRFKVVDADESAAARKNYTEQIGLITVAFYKGKLGSSTPQARGAVGTGMGSIERTQVGRYQGDKIPGDLIAVYNIRYMTLESLKQTER